MPRKSIQPTHTVEDLCILNEQGQVDEALVPDLGPDALRKIHEAMVLTRQLDERMIAMQRQGQMGTFAPGRGQEAAQIGSVYPLKSSDWFSPSYRSFGAQMWRGWSIERLMLLWDGYFDGFTLPDGVNDLPFSIVIGSHVPMAVGVAMAERFGGSDAVMLTNFGDGASSEGDVSESLNFAAVYKAPVIFICENNGYAISMAMENQTAVKSLAHRAPAFGMPGIRVDGNDILAMIVATTEAVDRARAGQGPTLIEAVTYRMEMHTTADDPKLYRSDEEVNQWHQKDPILRFEKYLLAEGIMDGDSIAKTTTDAKERVCRGRDAFNKLAKPNPQEVFDYVYAKPTDELADQKREYLRKLKSMLGNKTPTSV